MANSFSCPLGQEQCAEQRRHLLNIFVIELKKIKVLLHVKIKRKKRSYTQSNTNRKDLGV